MLSPWKEASIRIPVTTTTTKKRMKLAEKNATNHGDQRLRRAKGDGYIRWLMNIQATYLWVLPCKRLTY